MVKLKSIKPKSKLTPTQKILSKYQAYFPEHNNLVEPNRAFITVDPGARLNGGTGIAVFKWLNPEQNYYTLHYSDTYDSKQKDYELRVNAICNALELRFKQSPINTNYSKSQTPVFIERPKFFDDARGLVAAKSNSLFKLIYLYGRLVQLFTSLGYIVVPLEINHWKGHLSKKQTKERVKFIPEAAITPISSLSSDEIDAIVMGYYIIGKFK